MTILIEIEGSNDLKELADLVNDQQDLYDKIDLILNHLNYPIDGGIEDIKVIIVGSR